MRQSGSVRVTTMETVTDTGAVAAVASPFWLPSLHVLSEDAALLLPIFGVLWLAVQIAVKLWVFYKARHP